MNSIMRRGIRGAATGLGALALLAGASACGALGDLAGGDDGGDDPAVEQPADDEGEDADAEEDDASRQSEGSDDEADTAPAEGTDEGEDADQGEDAEGSDDEDAGDPEGEDTEDGKSGEEDAAALSEDELEKAGDRSYAFYEAIGEQDPQTACELVIDYETGEPAEGDGLQKCVDSFDDAVGEDFDPSELSMFERSMLQAEDNGDGRAAITVLGASLDMYMKKAGDGAWYIEADAPF